MALTFDLDFQIILKCSPMAFGLTEIDSKIIKFEQVSPDICHFIDLSLAIGGHLGNMQIKNVTGWNLVFPMEMMTLASTEHKSTNYSDFKFSEVPTELIHF